MISDNYKEQLQQHRAENPEWGSTAAKYAGLDVIRMLQRVRQATTVLDFGSGKGTLAEYIRANADQLDREIEVFEYDPSVPGKDVLPERQFDMIVSTDVMEHIEPEQLIATLNWLNDHAKLAQFHVIACGPTNRRLPDGRDVHLIQQSIKAWRGMMEVSPWRVQEMAEVMQRRRGHERHRGHIYMERT